MNSLALSFALLFLSPAYANDLAQDVIYRGRPVAADGQAWRSTVSLAYQRSNGAWHGCSGTFIAADLIVTAAHCEVSNRHSLSIEMFLSNDPKQKKQIWLEGKEKSFEFHVHPRYVPSSGYDFGANDLAIIVLRDELIPDGFEVAEVLHSGVKASSAAGSSIFIAGAGRTENGPGRDRILFAQGMLDGYDQGSRMVVSFPNGQGVCMGDSGGPFFVRSGKNLYLAAVLAHMMSSPGGHCGQSAYGTFLNADRYKWLQDKAEAVRTKFAREREARRKAEEEELRRQEEEEAKKNAPAPAPAPAPAAPQN